MKVFMLLISKAYLNQYKYDYVNRFDMYKSFQTQLDQYKLMIPKIEDFIQSWVQQNGLPVVHINIQNSTTLQLTQEYFLYDPSIINTNVDTK